MIELQQYLETKKTEVEQALAAQLPNHSQLDYAARHLVLAPAKRLRPILTLATSEIFGITDKTPLLPACAVELVHSYSLIHDDLPCMDDDDVRRGLPAVHKEFSEATAILAGDYLLSFAFEIIATASGINADQKVQLVESLAKASGRDGMVGGQMIDIHSNRSSMDLPNMESLHLMKTGALIATSIEFGAIIGNASDEQKRALRTFGMEIGLAFQILDDILDATDYVVLLGSEGAKKQAALHTENAIQALKSLPHDTYLLKNLAEQLLTRKK